MHLTNTVKHLRDLTAFTQAEIGSLLSVSADAFANYEYGRRAPSLSIALGLELIFGKPLTEVFPETALAIAERMIPPLQKLSVAIEGKTDAKAEDKRNAIAALSDRLAAIIPAAS